MTTKEHTDTVIQRMTSYGLSPREQHAASLIACDVTRRLNLTTETVCNLMGVVDESRGWLVYKTVVAILASSVNHTDQDEMKR